MQTVIIWDDCGLSPIQFYVVDGDFSHLNRIYINQATDNPSEEDLQSELYSLQETFKESTHEFPTDVVKNGAIVIVAGFLP